MIFLLAYYAINNFNVRIIMHTLRRLNYGKGENKNLRATQSAGKTQSLFYYLLFGFIACMPCILCAGTTIVGISSSSITVLEAKRSKTYKIVAEGLQKTEIVCHGKPATFNDLEPGMRVTVVAGMDPAVASRISAIDPPVPKITPIPAPVFVPTARHDTIVRISADSIMVQEPKEIVTYKILKVPKTEITVKGQPANLSDLTPGMRVTVVPGTDPTTAYLINGGE